MRNLSYKILFVLLIFSMYNLKPYLTSLLFPNHNTTDIQYSEENAIFEHFSYSLYFLSWISYLLFFLFLIWLTLKTKYNKYIKTIIVLTLIFFIYLPIFPLLNLVNLVLFVFCKNGPFIDEIQNEFPHHTKIENAYANIKSEIIQYNNNNSIECFRKNNPFLNSIDKYDSENCWRTLYLKKSGFIVKDIAPFFPHTMKVIQNEQIHNAFFSILDPKVEIKPHFGYFKGYLRYHLGVLIPEENGKRPYLICGGQKYIWKEKEGVLFDDMYMHYVKNPTNKKRIVLYLDIKRKNLPWLLDKLTDISYFLIENSIILQYFIKNQHNQDKLS